MSKPKFDRSKCETCQNYWSYPRFSPECHVKEKHIYEGECLAYKPVEQPMSKADRDAKAYDRYQKEWN